MIGRSAGNSACPPSSAAATHLSAWASRPEGSPSVLVDHENIELDYAVGVIMPQLQQRMTAAQRYSELFGQLARQAPVRCSHRGRSYRPETPSTRPCACRPVAARSVPVRWHRAARPPPRARRHSLTADQGAVAVLVFLPRAARTGLVAADLAVGTHEWCRRPLGCADRPHAGARRPRRRSAAAAAISSSLLPSNGCTSACCACSAFISRSRRSASSRSICSWVRISILVRVDTVSNFTRSSIAENSSKASRLNSKR